MLYVATMQTSNRPRRLTKPFASDAGSGFVRTVPTDAAGGGAASYSLGFPPETFQPVASGGVPPSGQDMNGVLFDVSGWARWLAGGGTAVFDAAFSDAVGGYPLGARLASTNNPAITWVSTVENNTSNPDAGGAGWVIEGTGARDPNIGGGFYQYGPFTINFGNVTQVGGSGVMNVTFARPFPTQPLFFGANNATGGAQPSSWTGIGNVTNNGMSVGMAIAPAGGGAGIPAPAGTAAWWWAVGI